MHIEFIKPLLVALILGYGVSLTDVTDVVKLISACAGFGYVVWKWISDARKK